MSNLTVENVYLRQEAKELAQKHRWTLFGMFGILYAISYAVSDGGDALLTALCGSSSAGNSAHFAYWLGYVMLMLVYTLVFSGLWLGLTRATIDIARDTADVRIRDVFCRMSACFKAFRLSLWIGLKAFLWALPAVAVTVVLAVALAYNPNSDVSQTLMMLLPLVIMIVVFALMLPAMYRYMLSTFILADAPETGVRECVNRSKAMMKGHKWQFFKLPMPFILALFGLYVAVTVAYAIITTLAGSAAAAAVLTLLYIAAVVVLVLMFIPRIYMCSVLFYLKRAAESTPATGTVEALPAAEAPAADVADTDASGKADVSAENAADEE